MSTVWTVKVFIKLGIRLNFGFDLLEGVALRASNVLTGKGLRFSKIVLEVLVLSAYTLNEFR